MTAKLILWHPVLFSIIFVMMPFNQYANLIPPSQVVAPFIVISAFAAMLYFIIKGIVKKAVVAVALSSPLLIVLCNYGTLYEYISFLTSETNLKGPVLALATVIILIILSAYTMIILRLNEGAISKVNKAFCVIAGALIVSNAFTINMQSIAFAKIKGDLRTPGTYMPKYIGPRPDIYFIILDHACPVNY